MLNSSTIDLNGFPFIFTFRNPDATYLSNIESIFDINVESYVFDDNGYVTKTISYLIDCDINTVSNPSTQNLINDLIHNSLNKKKGQKY